MRKVIGLGETILDIVFKDGQPSAAVPGGSVFNSLITLGRLGTHPTFISETGNDKVGRIVLDFLHDNGVDNSNVRVYPDGKTPISLAFLNERNDAEYEFYKNYPKCRLDIELPHIEKDDILLVGSYFVLNPVLRQKTREILQYANAQGAIIYYDYNFRATHRAEAKELFSDIMENTGYASIVRGSDEDLENIFAPTLGFTEAEQVYEHIRPLCPNFLVTAGAKATTLFTPHLIKKYTPAPIDTISTIGAGDNFNAGIVYGLLQLDVLHDDLDSLSPKDWDSIIDYAQQFSAEVCQSLENYIAKR